MDTQNSAPAPAAAPMKRVMDPAWATVQAAWKWWNQHRNTLLILGAIGVVPQVVGAIYTAFVATAATSGVSSKVIWAAFVGGTAIWTIVGLLWSIWTSIAIYTYILHADEHLSVGQCYSQGGKFFSGYFSASILLFLITFGGMILLLVPGIYWGLLFSLAPILVMVENKKPMEALKRSKQLVNGYWMDVFWRYFLFGLTLSVLGIAIWIVTFIFTLATHVISDQIGTAINGVLSSLNSVVGTPLGLVMTFLIYKNLKTIKG